MKYYQDTLWTISLFQSHGLLQYQLRMKMGHELSDALYEKLYNKFQKLNRMSNLMNYILHGNMRFGRD